MAVIVLGSINMDAVMTLAHLPRPGETLAAHALRHLPGGKGANQAVAAARLGARTEMIGAVGQDAFGDEMLAFLSGADVGTMHIKRVKGLNTGCAHVWVESQGENAIVIASGANASLDSHDVTNIAGPGDLCLAQLETPIAAVQAFFANAHARSAKTILNAAPALRVPPALFADTDILIVNETEASTYLARGDLPASPDQAAGVVRALLSTSDQVIILTMGAGGALIIDRDGFTHFPARAATVVDTTGAGDAFCGALAASLSEGRPLRDCMSVAIATASIVVGRLGAGVAMPHRHEVEAVLAGR